MGSKRRIKQTDPVNENYKKLLAKFGENLGRNLKHRARRPKRSATDRYGIGMSMNLRGGMCNIA